MDLGKANIGNKNIKWNKKEILLQAVLYFFDKDELYCIVIVY
jgi:hypothetical protein